MMRASNFTFFQLYLVLLILVTRTATGKVAQSVEEASENYHDQVRSPSFNSSITFSSSLQQNPSSSLTHHRPSSIDDSKQAAFHDDDNDDDETTSSNSDEKYINDSPHQWSDLASKHYPKKIVRTSDGAGNDGRLWAIPYRFGKRSAMPYRFGKRAGMHFRLGKKSASL